MLKAYERQGPGESAADWKMGKGIHARNMTTILRGVVEYNRDPDRRGRVKIRTIHDGPEMKITNPTEPRVSTLALKWYLPLFNQGAGMGFGSFTVPPVGARVYVLYEHGDVENGVYFGGWYAHHPFPRRYGVTETTIKPPVKRKAEDSGFDDQGNPGGDYYYPPKPTPYQGHWMEEQGPERPLELAEMVDHTPDTQLFFKTLKGASLLVKERDEAEEMVLTDRLGAELRFESNTPIIENGILRRGRMSASQHEPISLDNLAFNKHRIALLAANKAGLDITSTPIEDDAIILQTHIGDEIKRNVKEHHPNRVSVELDPGEQRVRILYFEEGVEQGILTFDVTSKQLTIVGLSDLTLQASKNVCIKAENVEIDGDLEVRGDFHHWSTANESNRVSIMDIASTIGPKEYK